MTTALPVVPDCEVVDTELWAVPEFRAGAFRKHLRDRGFILAKQCFYHPDHWSVEEATDEHWEADENAVYVVIDEAYIPRTDEARAWLAASNKTYEEKERDDADTDLG